jgi:hypothetical protein
MKLAIVRIADRSVPNKERLHLKALSDTNLSFFAVLATVYSSPTAISTLPRYVFWFKSKPVKAGDNIILCTAEGTPSEEKNADGTTTYFFYWGLKNTIWNKTGECAVIFEINSWQTSPYE